MVNIPSNFPKGKTEYTCICVEKENMKHIYNCELLSEKKEQGLDYEKIFNGNGKQQIQVYKTFQQTLRKEKRL